MCLPDPNGWEVRFTAALAADWRGFDAPDRSLTDPQMLKPEKKDGIKQRAANSLSMPG